MVASKSILMLSDNPGDDYVSRIKSAASRAASTAGFTLTSVNVYRTGQAVADLIKAGDYVGLILTPPVSDDRNALSLIEQRRTPYVRIAPLLDLERGDVVTMDEFQAASEIVGLMTARGHRRIGIMRGPSSQLVSMRRFNGYANAVGAKGMRAEQSLVTQGDFTRASGREQAARLFAAKPTAIFASNDEMAAGIIDAARDAGINIPGDISLVGFDDNAVATTVRPNLTTVRQPLEAMGEAAASLVIGRLKRPGKAKETRTIPFEIIERQSVADCVENNAAA